MDSIEDIKRKLAEAEERLKLEHPNPELNSPDPETEPDKTKKDLPEKEEIKPDTSKPQDKPQDDDDEDDMKFKDRFSALERFVTEMVKENNTLKSQLEKEKKRLEEALKPTNPDVIKIPTHDCECGATLRQRYLKCPVCGDKEPTKTEIKLEDEKNRLKKEQDEKRIKKMKDEYYKKDSIGCIIDEMIEESDTIDKICNIVIK